MEKKDIKIVLLIFFVALILRIGFILTLDNSIDVWGDWWDELGWKLATGQGYWVNNPYFPDGEPFYSWRTPGFPLFLAGIYYLFGHSYLAAKIGLAFISSVTSILLFFLAGLIINRKAGIICSSLYAVYPAAIFWTGYLAPETLAAFLMVLLAFAAIYTMRKDTLFWSFYTGIVFGLLFLTRPVVIVMLPVLVIYFFFNRKNLIPRLFLLFTGCLVITPWVIRNYKIHHTFLLGSTEGGVVFYIANNEKSLSDPNGFYHNEDIKEFRGLSEVETDRKFYRMGLEFVKENPGTYLKLVMDRFIRFWRFYPHTISGPGQPYSKKHIVISFLTECPLVIFGWIGFFLALREWRKFFVLHGFVITFSTVTILIRSAIRYRFPIMPFMLILTIYALISLKKNETTNVS